MNRIKLFALSIIVLAAAAFGLSSCSEGSESGADAQELEKLGDVQAVVREEGSGTRDVFEEATGITAKAEGEDRLRDDILEAASSDEVISLVEENVSAIGYVSQAGIDDDEAVKAVSIDGTAPDSSSIQSGDYELTRTFYLAYSGELNDLEKDFMSYVKGVGQNTVAEDYIAAGETGEDVFLSGKQEGTISINGSTSAAPLIEELAEGYEAYNPNAEIVIEKSDSTKGVNDAMQGRCDMAMVSRELESYEQELLQYEAVAKEGIAIIVNEENPIENITLDQIRDIYNGRIKAWSDMDQEK